MDYFKLIFKAIEEIERNLTEEISIEKVAEKCAMSPFHFHRIFKTLTGYSLMTYVRKRKLHKACRELITTDKKIIDISFDYNYESHEAFTRAVKKESGFSPSEIRHKMIENIGIDKMSAWGMKYRKNYGEETMPYEIITLDKIILAGVTSPMTLEDEKNYEEIGVIVGELGKLKNKIPFMKDTVINREFGIASCSILDLKNPYPNRFSYFRGVEIERSFQSYEGIKIITLSGIKCAKFYVGSTFENHKKALDYIYGVWLSCSSVELNRKYFDFMEEIIESPSEPNKIYFYIPIK